uniref:AMP-binding protein n=1 Tax=Nocardia abscessus TaxID=120957 RepID=UPI002454FDBC
ALLGVLAAGAAYLPIDLTYPAQRLAFVLADAAPVCVLTTAAERPAIPPILAPPPSASSPPRGKPARAPPGPGTVAFSASGSPCESPPRSNSGTEDLSVHSATFPDRRGRSSGIRWRPFF